MEAKKIIITGGATRIGSAIAKSLVSFETKIGIHFNKSKSSALKLKKELEELGAEAYLFKADLNNLKQTETLIKKAYKTLKGLDCLINNASIFENDNLENFSEKSFTKHMNINLKSPAILTQNFKKLIKGARSMDNHFEKTPFEKNLPIILGVLSIWYNNFYNSESEAVIPYCEYLKNLPKYLQQSVMESNGKSVNRSGEKINYQTSPIIWGASGTNSQHAFFQHIHQGTKLIPVDFIGFNLLKVCKVSFV